MKCMYIYNSRILIFSLTYYFNSQTGIIYKCYLNDIIHIGMLHYVGAEIVRRLNGSKYKPLDTESGSLLIKGYRNRLAFPREDLA